MVSQRGKHLGSSFEEDKEVDAGGVSEEEALSSKCEGKSRQHRYRHKGKANISEKQYPVYGQTRHRKGQRPSYKAQIKHSHIDRHSSGGCHGILPHPTSNPKCIVPAVYIFSRGESSVFGMLYLQQR